MPVPPALPPGPFPPVAGTVSIGGMMVRQGRVGGVEGVEAGSASQHGAHLTLPRGRHHLPPLLLLWGGLLLSCPSRLSACPACPACCASRAPPPTSTPLPTLSCLSWWRGRPTTPSPRRPCPLPPRCAAGPCCQPALNVVLLLCCFPWVVTGPNSGAPLSKPCLPARPASPLTQHPSGHLGGRRSTAVPQVPGLPQDRLAALDPAERMRLEGEREAALRAEAEQRKVRRRCGGACVGKVEGTGLMSMHHSISSGCLTAACLRQSCLALTPAVCVPACLQAEEERAAAASKREFFTRTLGEMRLTQSRVTRAVVEAQQR